MNKVIFKTTEVVCVEIEGEYNPEHPFHKKDGGLIRKFLTFLDKTSIPMIINPRCDVIGLINCDIIPERGHYRGFFTAENAVKIETWLLEQGAEHK